MALLSEVYVASFGNDITGDGSKENPFATLQHGVDVAENNSTIYVKSSASLRDIDFRGKQFHFDQW